MLCANCVSFYVRVCRVFFSTSLHSMFSLSCDCSKHIFSISYHNLVCFCLHAFFFLFLLCALYSLSHPLITFIELKRREKKWIFGVKRSKEWEKNWNEGEEKNCVKRLLLVICDDKKETRGFLAPLGFQTATTHSKIDLDGAHNTLDWNIQFFFSFDTKPNFACSIISIF